MSWLTSVAIVFLVVVALLVSLPILFETCVNVVAGLLVPNIRERPAVRAVAKLIDRCVIIE